MHRPRHTRPNSRSHTPSLKKPNPFTRRLRVEPLEDRRMLSITLFVDADAPEGGDGLSWETAFQDLQDGLSEAETRNGDEVGDNDVDAIWVAEGVYKPSVEVREGEARTATFMLVEEVAIYGGFVGTETTLAERDWAAHTTTLSGDIGVVGDASDNAYAVVCCVVTNATVNGMTIIDGHGDGPLLSEWDFPQGGGILNAGRLYVVNSVISENYAGYGGAIYNGWGGGSYADPGGAYVTLTGCLVTGNTAWRGGAAYNDYHATLVVYSSTFSGNSAEREGGAICNYEGNLLLRNATLAGNSAESGGGIFHHYYRNFSLANSIVAFNEGSDLIVGATQQLRVGNLIGIDPKFVRNPGTNGPDDYGDLRLTAESPAIDMGDTEWLPRDYQDVDADGDTTERLPLDMDANPRVAGAAVDVGAYEFQGEIAPGRESLSTVVTTASDSFDLYDGEISLREAVYYARSNSTGTTITFDSSLSGWTIHLNGSIQAEWSVSIDASSLAEGIILDAGGTGRILTVFADDEDHVDLIGLTITNGRVFNVSTEYNAAGGGVYCDCGSLNIVDANIVANSADGGGGGVSCTGSALVVNSTFSRNSARDGGGIYAETLEVASSRFFGNVAAYAGGAVFAPSLEMSNSLLHGNVAEEGGAISTRDLTMTSSTVAGNFATEAGGVYGFWYTGDQMLLSNSILAGNHQSSGGDFSSISLSSSSRANLISEAGNVIDPLFIRNPNAGPDATWGTEDDDYGDLRLLPASPGVDTGWNSELPLDEFDLDADGDTSEPIPFDLAGNPRVENGTVDIGAYEAPILEYDSIIYVDADAAPDGYGNSWESAFRGLQRALEVAAGFNSDGMVENDVDQIWIAEGVYRPDKLQDPDEPRSATFCLVDGVTLYGGFEGTEADPASRDWTEHETILCGDIGGVDDASDNAYTVVYCGSEVEAVIDGVTITDGNANGSYEMEYQHGGGAFVDGTLGLTNSIVTNNSAMAGAGIYCRGGPITIVNSSLLGNSAIAAGGAVATFTDCVVEVVNSRIQDNSAFVGGAFFVQDSDLHLANTAILGNRAQGRGGAVDMYGGMLDVSGSVFAGNSAGGSGAAVSSFGQMRITNATFSGNAAAGNGGAIYNYSDSSDAILANTVLAGNSAAEGPDLYHAGGTLLGFNCLIGDGAVQEALIDSENGNLVGTTEAPLDPLFLRDPSDGGDGWGDDPDTPDIDESLNDDYGDLRLATGSPAIDAGDAYLLPADGFDVDGDGDKRECVPLDFDGIARIQNGNVDMGAYETPSAFESPILLVNMQAPPRGNGSSWEDAIDDLQLALDIANCFNSDAIVENDIDQIWIAAGTYRPVSESSPGDPRSASFYLANNVALLGGFAGTEVEVSERDWISYETILSGDIGTPGDPSDNARNVVHCNIATHACLDGVTITDGYAENISRPPTDEMRGGGVLNLGTLHLLNSVLSRNLAVLAGGGICNRGTMSVTNSILVANVVWKPSESGGGIYNAGTIRLTNSTIAGNVGGEGGGVFNADGLIELTNSIVSLNYGDDISGVSPDVANDNLITLDPLFLRNPSDGGDGWGDDPDTPDIDESLNDDYGDLRLRPDSPAIDAGNNALLPADSFDLDADGDTSEPVPFDLAGNPRIQDGNVDGIATVDIGAYEYVPVAAIPGDLNIDGFVGTPDLDIVRANWGQSVSAGSLYDGDPSGDGTVGTPDLDIVRANWGQTVPAAASAASAGGDGMDGSSGAAVEETAVGPRRRPVAAEIAPRDALFANPRALAEAAWAEAIEGLKDRGKKREVATVDLALAVWGEQA